MTFGSFAIVKLSKHPPSDGVVAVVVTVTSPKSRALGFDFLGYRVRLGLD